MKHQLTRLAVALTLCVACANVVATPALAAKAASIGKLPGKAYVVRVTPDGKWLASWSQQATNKFTLYVVNLDKGDRREVTTVDDPGGICWLPKRGELLYCKGNRKTGGKIEYTAVTYFVYNTSSNESKKVGELNDLLQNYQIDPISSEDGSLAFHLTLSTTRTPSFNIYFPAEGQIKKLEVPAKIAADYDLSSDGSQMAWFLHGGNEKLFSIVVWDLQTANYKDLYEWKGAEDPASNHLMIRYDMPHNQVATLAVSDSDKQLNACIYKLGSPSQKEVVPIRLPAGMEAIELDWKGRSGILYMLAQNAQSKKYSIIEYNPQLGSMVTLLESPDEISHVEYAPGTQSYFYSVVAHGNKPETVLVTLK